MMEKINKGDFIEILFTGIDQNGEVFDSNMPDDLPKEARGIAKPFIFPLGHGMFLESIDNFLIGKDVGKSYDLTLQPKDAFGERDKSKVKIIPLRVFLQHKVNPHPGMSLNLDGQLVKVISVSGGRVMTDFNNPLAGKVVHYKIKVNRIVTDKNEQAKSTLYYFTKHDFKFEISENKLIVYCPKGFDKFLMLFKDKFKEILDLELNAIIDEELTKKIIQKHQHNNHEDHSHHDHKH
jgi:FKBP-type peptidyl-prolyl cis-trans isomerase 2